MKDKTGIVPADTTRPMLKPKDAFYHGGKKVGTVIAVLDNSYLIRFEPDANVKEASLEKTMEMIDKGII